MLAEFNTTDFKGFYFWESLIIQRRAEVRKINGRIMSKLRSNTVVFQGVWARL